MSEEKGVFEFGLQFHLDGLEISQDVKDSEVAGEIHRLLSERFKSFDVIVQRLTRDGCGRILSVSVGICDTRKKGDTT